MRKAGININKCTAFFLTPGRRVLKVNHICMVSACLELLLLF